MALAVTDAALIAGALVAMAGAATGGRVAIILLAALALSLVWAKVAPMPWPAMIAADLVILRLIWGGNFTTADKIIAALFPVAWVGYFLPPDIGYTVAAYVVATQLFLCAPQIKFATQKTPVRRAGYEAA